MTSGLTDTDHYRGDDFETRVLDALRSAGVDVDGLRVEDLAGVDQLHAGFLPASEHLLDQLALSADTPLLDVGSGVGGPARLAAARHGCRVTGIDLSPDFVELARSLTARVGLDALVTKPSGQPDAPNWKGPYLEHAPKDPWGHPYQYAQPGQHGSIDVYSLGADGKPGGDGEAADVGNWE